MNNQFSIITNIIHEEFNKNAFKTILNELTKICKSKSNKNQQKFFLLKIKIDIENTEINIINKLGQYFTFKQNNLKDEAISNINNTINNIKYFESSNSKNNSLIIDKLLSRTMKNYDDKNNKSLSLHSNKFKCRSNSNENIYKNLNVSCNNLYKKRNNSLSTNNIIKVTKKIKKKNANNKVESENKNIKKKKMEVSHQTNIIIKNNKEKDIFIFNKARKELAKEIIEFIDSMKLLQENIINKTTQVKNLKFSFEKNKNYLYQKACDIYNSKNGFDNNYIKKDSGEMNISTNYFNITIENISNNFHKTISDLKNKIEILEKKIKENEEVKKEINNIKIEHLNSIISIYNLLLSSNKSYNKTENNELDKEESKFNWYIKQITDKLNNINLNCSCHHKIINISDLNMEICSDNVENSNNKKENNNNSNKTNNSNNLEYAIILDDNNKDIDSQNYNELKNQTYKNILEIITNILPFIHLYNEKEKEKENESEIILKLKDDYEQKGLDFIFNILKSYIKQLVNIIKEFHRQSNLKEISNLNTNSSITKENDIYMQNIQKKFIIDYNNERLFDDEKQSNNYNINNSNWYKSIKTPNQTIKNICKEIDNRYGNDYQNKIYSIVSYIQNSLFSKIEYKENEKIELNNKMKELLKINKEIKNNLLLKENEIFLKKYNFLNSLYKEEQEKTKILEIEYFSLIKQLFNYIQNGDKIIIKLDKLFNKYNKINNNESLNNGHYDLGQFNESDLLSSIENVKNDDFINFLCQNDKDKINEIKNDDNKDLIIKYKKENEFLNKCANEMKIRLLTIKNNLNKLVKDDYINNNYKDLFLAIFKLLNYTDEQIKTLF